MKPTLRNVFGVPISPFPSLFDHDRDNADTTLIVGNKRLKAHSFALTLRSRFFAGALLGGFRVR